MKTVKLISCLGLSLFFSAAFGQQSNASATNSPAVKSNNPVKASAGAEKYRAELAARRANQPAVVKGAPEKGRKEATIKFNLPHQITKKPDANLKNQQAQPQGK